MEKTAVSRNQLVNQLLHMGHGDLSIYNDIGLKAVKAEPELFGHLIAWNTKKGEVRDSKVALPVLNCTRMQLHTCACSTRETC